MLRIMLLPPCTNAHKLNTDMYIGIPHAHVCAVMGILTISAAHVRFTGLAFRMRNPEQIIFYPSFDIHTFVVHVRTTVGSTRRVQYLYITHINTRKMVIINDGATPSRLIRRANRPSVACV